MKHLFPIAAGILAGGALSFAAAVPRTELHGDYVESRTADVYTGPCFANGQAFQVGDLAVLGWNIQQGTWQGVPLDGLSVAGVIKASGTLGIDSTIYPVKAVLILDQRANPEQRAALMSFARRMGGGLLQDIVRVEVQPITFTLRDNNLHTAQAALRAGDLALVRTRALTGADEICHNETTFYPPLTKLDHAMPAYTLANRFDGRGLGTVWSSPGERSAFVGSFHLDE
jgi:hypothetical protein